MDGGGQQLCFKLDIALDDIVPLFLDIGDEADTIDAVLIAEYSSEVSFTLLTVPKRSKISLYLKDMLANPKMLSIPHQSSSPVLPDLTVAPAADVV
jgi:hypothetical protein